MKKLLSVLLSFAILFTTFSITGLTANTPELIKNGSFEEGSVSWELSGGEISSAEHYAGFSSLKLPTGNYSKISQKFAVEKNTDYIVTFYYKGTSSWMNKWGVGNSKGVEPDQRIAGGSLSSVTSWTRAFVNFNSGDNSELYFTVMSGSGANIYIDDVQVTIDENASKILKNGGFEDGANYWGARYNGIGTCGQITTDAENVHSGESAGYATTYYISNAFTVEPNTDYIVKFYMKGAQNDAYIWSGTVANAAPQLDSYIAKTTFSSASEWVQKKITFNSGDNTTVTFAVRTGGSRVYIDDVEAIVDPDFGKILKNGGFESGKDYWQGSITVSTSEHYEGAASIKLPTGNYSKISQKFAVIPNTNYTMTFYYKGTSCWMNKWAVRDTKATNPEPNESIIQGSLASKTEWTAVSEHFNSGSNSELYFIIMSGSGADIYLDNVSVVLKAYDIEDDLLIKNYSFERGKEKWSGVNDSGTVMVTDTESAVGQKSLKLENGNYVKAYQGFNVEKNTDYIVNFKCYAPTVNWATKWGIAVGAGQSVDDTATGRICGAGIVQSDTWQGVMVKFNSGNNEKLHIIFQGYGGTCYYIDEVFVLKADKIVLNGSFENNFIGWNVDNGSFAVSEEMAKDERRSVNAKDGYFSMLSQLVAIEKQTNYKITFHYKGKIDSVIPNYAVTHTKASFEEGYLIKKGTLTTAEEWTEISTVFNSGENELLYILFQTTAGCDYFIDNISINKTDEEADEFKQGVTPRFIGRNRLTQYACTGGVNLVTDSGFEKADGNWKELLADGVITVTDEKAKNGTYSLKFNAENLENKSLNAFYVEVEPNTDYIFSTWVYGNRRSDDNRTDMEFGVIDVNTGRFLPSIGNGNTDRIYTTEHQMSPPSWDEEWHVTGITFNSGTASHIGIMIKGSDSTAYFDDMYICKLDEAQIYVAPEDSKEDCKITNLEPKLLGCNDKDNIIENYNFSSASNEFWQTGKVFGNQVTISETGGTKGKSLKYVPVSKYPYRTYYIKYVDVEPDTEYTFSAKYNILEAGDGFFGVINGNQKLPETIIQYPFDESHFSADYKWQTVGFTFKTGGYDRIGLVVFDGGGKTYIDDMRLFKTTVAKKLVETDNFPKKITSDTYTVDDNYLTGIMEKTSLKTLISGIDQGKYIRVFKGETEIKDLSVLATTDMEIRLMDGPEIKHRLRLVVKGDVNCDGKTTTADSDIILKYLTKKTELKDSIAKAADADNDSKITIYDAVAIVAHAIDKRKF